MNKATRRRRAVWGDARFLVGIVMVALSIGGVWLVVSSASATSPVLQANRTIVQGEALVSNDFRVVEVNLGAIVDTYLAPQDLVPGLVAARTVSEGELLPSRGTTDAETSRTTTVVVESSTGIPAQVKTGSVVELWHAPTLDESGETDVPRLLVADVTVAEVTSSEGVLAAGGTSVELVVERADVADVLAAITGGSLLSIVPIGAAP
ncbi:SAF domain-containing protein [Microbacterium sp. 3J1]|uniref:SAF domain-containing protein n=1 Tax=Microbacterium sp. 3J1 TaxID=861269 RepID=UPI000B2077FA|nr:SAF domain-containing protein [Microbacterium sp. 3J1]